MIPKIIHYCWFGGKPLPKLAIECIKSWKKYCPGYQIIEWNETNFDINYNQYVKEAYEAKKWAFVSDVARLYAIVSMGGIYMDTDVELIRPLDNLLDCGGFSGFESTGNIQTGIIACEKGNKLFKEFLDDYEDKSFYNKDGSLDLTTNVIRITSCCKKYGLILNNRTQKVNNVIFYSSDYFCPKDYDTKKITLSKNTICIHHFNGSWIPFWTKVKYRIFEIIGPKATATALRFKSYLWKKHDRADIY